MDKVNCIGGMVADGWRMNDRQYMDSITMLRDARIKRTLTYIHNNILLQPIHECIGIKIRQQVPTTHYGHHSK